MSAAKPFDRDSYRGVPTESGGGDGDEVALDALREALYAMQELQTRKNVVNQERALAITKVEEAVMWLQKAAGRR